MTMPSERESGVWGVSCSFIMYGKSECKYSANGGRNKIYLGYAERSLFAHVVQKYE